MGKTEITLREAGSDDLETILHHRRLMFRDMGEGLAEELDRMVEVARPWLARALAEGSYRHWLAIDSSGVVAGGGGVLSAAFGGGDAPQARSRDAANAAAAAVNAGRMAIGALIGSSKVQGATARDGLIFIDPYRQAWQEIRSYARV